MQTISRTYQNGAFTSSLTSQKSVSKLRINYVYGYQGSECDPEVKGEGNSYTTEFRQLDPRIGRWLTIDPKANAWESPYVSMANSPILFNDVKGDIVPIIYGLYIVAEAVVAYAVYDGVAEGLEHSTGNRNVRQTGYGMQHPYNSTKVLKAKEISGNLSINISNAIGKPSNKDGTPQNAIRHTLWNALMTKSIGTESAKDAANSHETDIKIDWNQMTFDKDFDADKSVDLRNNIIGRRIGEKNKDLSNTDIAKKVLEEYHTNGLWTSKLNKDGTYTISKTKLSTDEYKKALAEINISSNETGKHKK